MRGGLSQQEKQEAMLHEISTGPVHQLICRNAVPTILTMLVTSMYNFADTYFVSGMSDEATAAVGIVYSLVSLTQAIGYFWGQGSANYIARSIGHGDNSDSREMAQTGFIGSLLCGALITILGLLFLSPLCKLLGAPDEILLETETYCAIILTGVPFQMAMLTMNCQFRYQGNALSSMIGITSGAVLNVALDPLLIYGFSWGLAGAAWATVISQVLSFFVLLCQSYTRGNIPLRLKLQRLRPPMLVHILPGGMPSLWRNGLLSVSVAVLNTVSKPYGVSAVAAMSVVSKIMSVCIALPTGFGQGAQPVWGMNYGAGRYDRVLSAYRFALAVGFSMDLVVASVCYFTAPQLIGLFQGSSGSGIMDYGVWALRYQCLTFPLTAFLLITNMMVQSLGKMFAGTFLAVARNGLYFIPIVLILPRLWGVLGVQLSQPAADICAFISTFFIWYWAWQELTGRRPIKQRT